MGGNPIFLKPEVGFSREDNRKGDRPRMDQPPVKNSIGLSARTLSAAEANQSLRRMAPPHWGHMTSRQGNPGAWGIRCPQVAQTQVP
jgi:hypothetical protein